MAETQRTDSVMTTKPLDKLAAEISASTSIVTKWLEANGHPQPSFGVDSPQYFPSEAAPPEVQAARLQLITKARELQLLAGWPSDTGFWLGGEVSNTLSCYNRRGGKG